MSASGAAEMERDVRNGEGGKRRGEELEESPGGRGWKAGGAKQKEVAEQAAGQPAGEEAEDAGR